MKMDHLLAYPSASVATTFSLPNWPAEYPPPPTPTNRPFHAWRPGSHTCTCVLSSNPLWTYVSDTLQKLTPDLGMAARPSGVWGVPKSKFVTAVAITLRNSAPGSSGKRNVCGAQGFSAGAAESAAATRRSASSTAVSRLIVVSFVPAGKLLSGFLDQVVASSTTLLNIVAPSGSGDRVSRGGENGRGRVSVP